jgi:hypothetical protein
VLAYGYTQPALGTAAHAAGAVQARAAPRARSANAAAHAAPYRACT